MPAAARSRGSVAVCFTDESYKKSSLKVPVETKKIGRMFGPGSRHARVIWQSDAGRLGVKPPKAESQPTPLPE